MNRPTPDVEDDVEGHELAAEPTDSELDDEVEGHLYVQDPDADDGRHRGA